MSGPSPAGAAVIMGVRISWTTPRSSTTSSTLYCARKSSASSSKIGVRVSSAQIFRVASAAGSVAGCSVAAGSVAGGSVTAGSVAAGSVAGADVGAAPPHADSKRPSTVMNENSVPGFFMASLLLFEIQILNVAIAIVALQTVGKIHPMIYFDYREQAWKRLA